MLTSSISMKSLISCMCVATVVFLLHGRAASANCEVKISNHDVVLVSIIHRFTCYIIYSSACNIDPTCYWRRLPA